jgi:hypothetical protein
LFLAPHAATVGLEMPAVQPDQAFTGQGA